MNNHIGDANKMVGATQEAVGWQWRWLDTDNKWSEWADGGSRKEIDARIARWMVDGEGDRLQVRPVFAAPVAAAPGLDPGLYSWLKERGIAPDSHDGLIEMDEVVEALNEHERQLLASTPAAPGIDLRKLTDSWLEQAERVSAKSPDKAAGLWACAKELRDLIDTSPKGGSADPRGLKLPCLPFAVFDEFGVGADDRVADYGRACAAAAMQATSAEVGS
ncbi:hypothetical protein [Stenotrophomonas pigmentata]|uniref:hypothetical protein n=1 Tax=Stenotrophomonas pigmentata TaxID=3055080 RepID=UPI0026EB8AC5|nr:hypothetical protein [Stenotrophomonas sp. 610A2]